MKEAESEDHKEGRNDEGQCKYKMIEERGSFQRDR